MYKGYVRSFETVADMKAATDLKAGMTCHTNGFHSAGDGGAAWYKVTSTGTANEMDVIALQDGLIATLVIIENHVTPEMFGAYGDGTHNDAQSVKRAISVTLSVDAVNTYLISDVITISNNFKLDGCTTGKFILNKDVSGEYTMSIHDCSFVINRMNFEIPEWSLLKYDASGSANDIRIYDVNDSRFSNCTFNAMNTKFNGIIDFIRDWNNVVIDNCQFKADATFDGSRHAGGVWIRNANVEQTHDECHNIVISNCSFDINSNDEPLAIWASKTDKPIKNVSLINTYIKGYED